MRVGQGFGGFLGLRERSSSSYINARGAACPLQVEFLFLLSLRCALLQNKTYAAVTMVLDRRSKLTNVTTM